MRAAQRGLHFDPEQVVVSPGAKPNLFFAALALIEPGDEVLYPDPGFPTYRAMIEVAGGTPVPVPLEEENDFSFDIRAFDRLINDRTRSDHAELTRQIRPAASSRATDLRHIAEPRPSSTIAGCCRTRSTAAWCTTAPRGAQHRHPPGNAGTHHHRGWLLQDLRHDRLAARIRHHAGAAGEQDGPAADALGGLDGALHADRGHRGAHGAAGAGRRRWCTSISGGGI